MNIDKKKSVAGNVLQLVREIKDVSIDEQHKVRLAIEEGLIPGSFPTIEYMIRELKRENLQYISLAVEELEREKERSFNSEVLMLLRIIYFRHVLMIKVLRRFSDE